MQTTAKNLTMGLLLGAASVVGGCGGTEDDVMDPTNVPTMPALKPGEAMLAGKVADATGAPIVGATLVVAETNGTAVTGADGRYMLVVPAESTITLVAKAEGFAPTYVESIEIPPGKSSSGFDVLMITPAKVDEYNLMIDQYGLTGRPDKNILGVMAVKVQSLSGRCAMGGAKITVDPTGAGKLFYAKSATNGVGEPDPVLTGVTAQTGVAAWLAGILPPGTTYAFRAEQTGCTSRPGPIEIADRIHTGHGRIAPKALTQLTLFLD